MRAARKALWTSDAPVFRETQSQKLRSRNASSMRRQKKDEQRKFRKFQKQVASRLSCKVNVDFLIAGVQRSGTSTLAMSLRQHPEICMSIKKEVHFFDRDKYFSKGNPDYNRYHRFFHKLPAHLRTGEATPSYIYYRQVPARILAYNPDMKFILMFRNPITRAYSHWNREYARGIERREFKEALNDELKELKEGVRRHRRFAYIDRGFYDLQLKRLWDYFPREQILLLRSEDFELSPLFSLKRIWKHLQIEESCNLPRIESLNVGKYACGLGHKEKELLKDVYEKSIRQFEKITGWDCSSWLNI